MRWIPIKGALPLDPVAKFRVTLPGPQNASALWWLTLVELANTSVSAFENAVAKVYPKASEQLVIPDVYRYGDPSARQTAQFIAVLARKDLLIAMNKMGNPFGVVSLEVGSAHEPGMVNNRYPRHAKPPIKVTQNTILTLVIDDGIAIAHDLFMTKERKTRIAWAYFMGGKTNTPGFLSLGRSFSQDVIDDLLMRNTTAGLLDEDAFYREAGIVDFDSATFNPTALRRSHGTHILSVAAGFLPDHAPRNRPILCATLPSSVTMDVSGQSLAPSLALALDTLLAESQRYIRPDGTPAPVTVNFSYGSFGGPHDGTDIIPQLLEQRFAGKHGQTRWLVMPAGNGNMSRTHARLRFDDKAKTHHLRFNAMPDDRTASYVQHWMPYSAENTPPDFARFRVKPPGGPQSPEVRAREHSGYELVNDDGEVLATVAYHFIEGATRRGQVLLSLGPTGSLDPCSALAPAGAWKVEVTGAAISKKETIEVWIRRDETLPGYPPFGRQGFFEDSNYQRFDEIGAPLAVDPKNSDSLVRRAGLLNGIATGKTPFVIAGLSEDSGLLADYSAAGPITPLRDAKKPNRSGPDATAPSDDSPVRPGIIGAGSRSGSYIRLNGTSIAAPMVTRILCDGMADGHFIDRAWLAKRARQEDKTYRARKPEKSRVGAGRLRQRLPWHIGK